MMWPESPDMCLSEDSGHLDGQLSPEMNNERVQAILGERVEVEIFGCQGRSVKPEMVKA